MMTKVKKADSFGMQHTAGFFSADLQVTYFHTSVRPGYVGGLAGNSVLSDIQYVLLSLKTKLQAEILNQGSLLQNFSFQILIFIIYCIIIIIIIIIIITFR